MNRDEAFKFELSKNNLSCTNARKKIFSALLHSKPIGASKLANRLKNQVDRATVYRTLDTFEKIGVAQRTWLGFKSQYELAELFLPHHHHLTCIKCKRIEVIDDNKIETELNMLSNRHGFKLTDHLLEIRGVCQNCR